jgi:hypothetical protein
MRAWTDPALRLQILLLNCHLTIGKPPKQTAGLADRQAPCPLQIMCLSAVLAMGTKESSRFNIAVTGINLVRLDYLLCFARRSSDDFLACHASQRQH